MYARAVQQLPEGKDWLYAVKFHGYRCLAGRDSTGVTMWSRRANRFTNQFPTIAKACEHLPPDTRLGEIIALDNTGRISFITLQHHRSQAQAILFYAFDVIIHRAAGSFIVWPNQYHSVRIRYAPQQNAHLTWLCFSTLIPVLANF